MKEINVILKSIDNDSLVLIDELCRSTNPKEGLALSIAICEYIINDIITSKDKVFVFYATHFQELKCLEVLYSKVSCYQFDIQLDKNKRIRNTFKAKKEFSKVINDNYGIN
jgi:DNA mismatch repair ATPase MutS